MQSASESGRAWLFGAVIAMGLPLMCGTALASTEAKDTKHHAVIHHPTAVHPTAARTTHHTTVVHHVARQVVHTRTAAVSHPVVRRVAYHTAWMSCVPYARGASGISVAGNAWQWWDHAKGIYARGSVPEPGSVLTFRANGRMHLGHVAVVSRVINNREIEIDHANWAGNGIMHNVPVVDVSENNDWTAVRVGLGRSDSFGSVYPTYGFIYNRPDDGKMLVAITAPAPAPSLNPAPRDLRTAAERAAHPQSRAQQYDEVAEAPETPRATHGTVRIPDHH